MHTLKKDFGSDNQAGISSEILDFLSKINTNHCHGYGDDPITEKAITLLKSSFGDNAECFFTLNGTGTNTTALNAITRSYHSILCAETAHINTDECGALEKITGNKIIPIPSVNGKISTSQVETYLTSIGNPHKVQPKVISISQPTELGTLYQKEEIEALAKLAHQHNMYLHIDGARLSNAAVALNLSFKELTADCGVDIVSFGGTKNGMMIGEVIISFIQEANEELPYLRKQNNQLLSKMRFISGPFIPFLEQNLWYRNARKANQMAQYLYSKIKDHPQINVIYPVDTNALFVKLPPEIVAPLQEAFFFYPWNIKENTYRWMTCFDTTEKDIDLFYAKIEELSKKITK